MEKNSVKVKKEEKEKRLSIYNSVTSNIPARDEGKIKPAGARVCWHVKGAPAEGRDKLHRYVSTAPRRCSAANGSWTWGRTRVPQAAGLLSHSSRGREGQARGASWLGSWWGLSSGFVNRCFHCVPTRGEHLSQVISPVSPYKGITLFCRI